MQSQPRETQLRLRCTLAIATTHTAAVYIAAHVLPHECGGLSETWVVRNTVAIGPQEQMREPELRIALASSFSQGQGVRFIRTRMLNFKILSSIASSIAL